jgi:SAM-dependent methyltransferase
VPGAPADNPWLAGQGARGADYDRRFDSLAAQGQDVHGEARRVASLKPRSVLDAGCGTGRVAIELDRMGIEVVGVDLDTSMLEAARARAPHLDWRAGDLASMKLGRYFDAIVAAGNVLIFLTPGTEAAVVANLARHLEEGGSLIAGFSLGARLSLADYDHLCAQAGLELHERWATWDADPFVQAGDYAVSVHVKPTQRGAESLAQPRASS